MGKYKTLANNTIIMAIGSFASKAMMFFLLPIFTTYLLTDEYGLADILYSSIDLLFPLLSICIIEAVFRFTMDDSIDKELILSMGLRIVAISNIIMIALLPILLVFKFKADLIIAYAVFFMGFSLSSLFSNFIRGINKIIIFVIGGVATASLLVLFSFIFLKVIPLGLTGYILAYGLAYLFTAVLLFLLARLWKYLTFRYSKDLLKEMLRYSIYLIPNSISWFLVNISNRYIILGLCGASLAGIYAVATKLPSLINVASTIFQQAWQISAVKEYQSKDNEEYQSKVLKFYNTGMIIVASVVLLLNPYLSKFFLKNEFYEGWYNSGLLIIASYLGSVGFFFGTVYQVIKRNKMGMVSTLIGGVITLLFTFILVKFIGITGAAYASVIGYLVITIIRMIDTKKYINIRYNPFIMILEFLIILVQAVAWLYLNFNIALIINAVCLAILLIMNIRYICTILNTLIKKFIKKDNKEKI